MGNVTHANTAVAADAAAFCVLTARHPATQHAVQLLGGVSTGGDPYLPGLAPIRAIENVLDRHQLNTAKLTHIEIMEAFAVQALALHPRRGSGPRPRQPPPAALWRAAIPLPPLVRSFAVRLFHDLRNNGGIGIAAIAAAGGLGTALLLRAE